MGGTGEGEGMSTGAKTGLGVGIALGLLAAAAAGGVWIWKKRQRKDAATKQVGSENRIGEGNGGYDHSDTRKASWAEGGGAPVEVLGTSVKDTPRQVAEVGAAQERGWRGFGRQNGSVYELGSV